MNDSKMMTKSFISPHLFLKAPCYSITGYDVQRLPEVLQDQVFRNAVWLASPQFFAVLEKKGFSYQDLSDKEKFTVFKYYNRMCFRPVPFGAFASSTRCQWSQDEKTCLVHQAGAHINVLPDQRLRMAILAKRGVPADLMVFVNPTVYRFGNMIRFIQSAVGENGSYRYGLSEIEADSFYSKLFRYFNTRQLSGEKAVHWIAAYAGCSREEAVRQLEFLLEEQVLLGSVSAPLIGVEGAFNENSGFGMHQGTYPLSKPFRRKFSVIQRSLSGYGIPADQPFLYAALTRDVQSGGPGPDCRRQLEEGLLALDRLAPPFLSVDLENFKKSFALKYDLQKIGLMEVLDPDTGISYAGLESGALEGGLPAVSPAGSGSSPTRQLTWTAVNELFSKLWLTAPGRGKYDPVLLGDDDLSSLPENNDRVMPPGMSVMFRQLPDRIVIEQASGTTATSLIARFSAFSTAAGTLCSELAAYEQSANPDVIFADIGLLTDLHTDNINRRKACFSYEIPVNLYSAMKFDKQLPPSDLVLSMQQGELVLESRGLQKRVIPRLCSAFNFRRNELAVFRLLCDLQFQGLQANLGFDLEQLFPGLEFYPRVQFKDTVLTVAKWILPEPIFSELKVMAAAPDYKGGFKKIKNASSWPDVVMLGDHDQQLVFDLRIHEEVAYFLKEVQQRSSLTIREYLAPGNTVKSGHKAYAGQFIAFIQNSENVYHRIASRRPYFPEKTQRIYPPGSNWVYFKVYCSPAAANTLIREIIAVFLSRYRKLFSCWFFIRYQDSEHHLRFRVYSTDTNPARLILAFGKLVKRTKTGRLVRDWNVAAYEQELERYGAGRMKQVELLFQSGSGVIVENLLTADPLPEEELAFLSSWAMCNAFFSDLTELQLFASRVYRSFSGEFLQDKPLTLSLDRRFRDLKNIFLGLINGIDEPGSLSRSLANLAAHCRELNLSIEKEVPKKRLAFIADLVHMQMNRCFSADQRKNEMVNYYLLSKFAASLAARRKKPAVTNSVE